MERIDNESNFEYENNLKITFFRFLSYWPIYLISVLIFLVISFLYLRYSEYQYVSKAKIEIIDKSQDSEMALPTAMTIFNRSMINLENEIGVISSYQLHEKVVSKLKSNIKFYKNGRLKSVLSHSSEIYDDYLFELNINSDTISEKSTYNLKIDNDKLKIEVFDKLDNPQNSYIFNGLETYSKKHDLPFDIKIYEYSSQSDNISIYLHPFKQQVNIFKELVNVTPTSKESDQLQISITYPNQKLADEYLNTLIYEFDLDGITDRQLEYKRTMDFVDSRSVFLSSELEKIELKKQEFKKSNNLSDISVMADLNISTKYNYNAELFETEGERELIELLSRSIEENGFGLIPVNFGLKNSKINELIIQYNNLYLSIYAVQ